MSQVHKRGKWGSLNTWTEQGKITENAVRKLKQKVQMKANLSKAQGVHHRRRKAAFRRSPRLILDTA
jgi:hypothetical protein